MKKILLGFFCTLLTICSIGLTSATDAYQISKLNNSEKIQIERVSQKVITIINNNGGCEGELYTKFYDAVETRRWSMSEYSKGHAVLTYLRVLMDQEWNKCQGIDDVIISDVFEDIEQITQKKGAFKKYIGASIEARQNSMYTYFYHNDILINTIKNEVNNDRGLIYGYSEENHPFAKTHSTESFNTAKLELYYADFLGESYHMIHFRKATDTGVRNFFYNTRSGKWTEVGNGKPLLMVDPYETGYFIVVSEAGGTSLYYFHNDELYYIFNTKGNYITDVSVNQATGMFEIEIGSVVIKNVPISTTISNLWK